MLDGKKVVVIGASEGIGLSVARAAHEQGAHVTIAARSADKLAAAIATMGQRASAVAVDATDETALSTLFGNAGPVDHVVLTVGGRVGPSPFAENALELVEQAFARKFWTQLRAAHAAIPHIRQSGSLTFTSGGAGRRAPAGMVWLSGINAAIEATSRALAVECAPRRIRVNTICPGVVDTAVWADMPAQAKAQWLERAAQRLPVGFVAGPDDVASAYLFVMENTYTCGATIDVDGGFLALPA